MPDLMKKQKEIDQKVSTGSLGNYDTNTRQFFFRDNYLSKFSFLQIKQTQQTSREQTSNTRRVEPNETG